MEKRTFVPNAIQQEVKPQSLPSKGDTFGEIPRPKSPEELMALCDRQYVAMMSNGNIG